MTMTPPHMDSPLRRSEIGAFRTPVQTPVINDDDAERREARRRTAGVLDTPSQTVEGSETLKDCLQQCNDKLSRDNAWAVSVIDTLSALMSKHHKALSNFKVAGSSLEASSRVYALRVDSVHSEVLRMSSGLNKQKVISENDDEPDATQHDENHRQEGDGAANEQVEPTAKRKKRTRKPVSTITKNKETINAHLDTNPFMDPIFAKMNSGTGHVSGSNRLLQNVLHSVDSELRLRMNYPFWDSKEQEVLEYPEEFDYKDLPDVDGDLIENLILSGTVLRPQLSGYTITDTPAEDDDQGNDSVTPMDEDMDPISDMGHHSDLAVAFDINAAVEPSQPDIQPFVDVDMGDFEELTAEEQVAINNCKGLRRAPVVIEDMRPVDSSSSTLEYSYRPLDKISQFWAGPSHWKFKKTRNKSLSLAQRMSANNLSDNVKRANQRGKRKLLKFRTQPVEFLEVHDELFEKLDEKSKLRKANVQKKWDAKKLKLPTDLQIDRNIHDVFHYAPGVQVMEEVEPVITPDIPDGPNYDHPADDCDDIPNDGNMSIGSGEGIPSENIDIEHANQTVMEIATDFVGAPDKVTRIIVPFAKRAKVVDMKQLKKCCSILMEQQLNETGKENIEQPKGFETERYRGGVAGFNKIYAGLPRLLTQNMTEALSTAVAFYSILHLANEANLRLVMDDTLDDFQIRKIED